MWHRCLRHSKLLLSVTMWHRCLRHSKLVHKTGEEKDPPHTVHCPTPCISPRRPADSVQRVCGAAEEKARYTSVTVCYCLLLSVTVGYCGAAEEKARYTYCSLCAKHDNSLPLLPGFKAPSVLAAPPERRLAAM